MVPRFNVPAIAAHSEIPARRTIHPDQKGLNADPDVDILGHGLRICWTVRTFHQLSTKVPSVARLNIDTSTYMLRAGGICVVPNQCVIT
jgi:hypothetical protein